MKIYKFGKYHYNPAAGSLSRGGRKIVLRPQAASLLELLIKRRGETVSRDEIHGTLWKGRTVSFDNSIDACVRDLRKALDDSASAPRYIRTVPMQGYSFIGDTDEHVAPDGLARKRMPGAIAAGAVVVLAGLWAVMHRDGDADPGPQAARTHYITARAHIVEGAYTKALAELEIAADTAPASAEIAAAMSYAQLHAPGDFHEIRQKARQHALRALMIDERNAEALAVLGNIALSFDAEMETADSYLSSALEAAPGSAYAHHSTAFLALVRGDAGQARRHMAQAAAIDPVSAPVIGDYAWLELILGNYEQSLHHCRRLEGLLGQHRRVFSCYFSLYMAQQDSGAAAGLIEEYDYMNPQKLAEAHDSASPGAERAPQKIIEGYLLNRLARHTAKDMLVPADHLEQAMLNAWLGREEEALARLDSALSGGGIRGAVFLSYWPSFRSLCRQQPFPDLLQSANLPATGCRVQTADTL